MATKRTYQPKKRRRIKRLGFRARMSTVGGKNVLKNRRKKKRSELTVSESVRSDKNKRLRRRR